MKIIGVIGGHIVNKRIYNIAYETGKLIAENGFALVTGGLGGVMEAASKGAKEKGGIVLGILPGTSKSSANAYVDIPIPTGMSEMRNMLIVRTTDAIIAIDGKKGTQSEIAFALILEKKIVGIECNLPFNIERVSTPAEAIEIIKKNFKEEL